MKIDLSDVTFNIPVKIDSRDRARNLFVCVNYINRYFDTNIIVCEQNDNYVADILKNAKYIYLHFESNVNKNEIHRTAQLNLMCMKSNTPIIVNYDCDVLLPIDQYVISTELIRNNEADVVYPYNGQFLNIDDKSIEQFMIYYDLDKIDKSNFAHIGPPDKPSVGGAIFYNKQSFINSGMENENFFGWGFEDNERFYRFNTLGLKIKRTDKSLYHMNHEKVQFNSSRIWTNSREMNYIKSLDKEQLLKLIKTWEWCKDYIQ